MSEELQLKKVDLYDGRDIYEMLQEMPRDENGFINSVFGLSYDEYLRWVELRVAEAKETQVKDGRVPQTVYWLFAGEKPVGITKLRHTLTPALLERGGNIGYSIRPGERGKGYGKAMLSRILDICRDMGLERVLITANTDNTPSVKTALSCGGEIEKEQGGEYSIWIDIK